MAGLYIHVPFCQKRCLYCDFYSNTDMGYKQAYLDSLIREMDLRKAYLQDEPLETIYFGGGTPSQLSSEALSQIFDAIFQTFPVVSETMEITLEANPDDLTEEYVADLCQLPVNRVSMGVQSFDDDDLTFLNRRHDKSEAIDAVERLQRAGLENISIDLIYGLPGQTLAKWQKNIDEALRLQVPHISAYHLIYEEGTAMYRLLEAGKIEPVEEDMSVMLFSEVRHRLMAAGYEHYEISNFAKPGRYSKHNSSYWKGKRYLGLGPSAHSYNGVEREWNAASLPIWIEGFRCGHPKIEYERLDADTSYNDYVVTHLRTMWGIDLEEVKQTFGDNRLDYCLKMAKKHIVGGLLEKKENKLCLTEAGIFVSDGIMSDLLLV